MAYQRIRIKKKKVTFKKNKGKGKQRCSECGKFK